MRNFDFCSPTRIIFGRGTENGAGRLCAQNGATKALVHYGGESAVRSGLLHKVQVALEEAGVGHTSLGGVYPNPGAELVRRGIQLCRQEEVDFILAVGGGSVIDSAKAIAAGVAYKGDFWDFYEGVAGCGTALPLGVVLTIPASGSEASAVSVITNEKSQLKRSYRNNMLRPRFAILDPLLTFTLPPYQTACGAVDIISHVLERYFTNEPGVLLSDSMCEAIISTVMACAPIAIENPEDYDARANLMWAGTLAHNDLLSAGRQDDWASHQLAHELSAKYGVTHGAALSVIFPAWMRYVYKHDLDRFCRFSNKLFGVTSSNQILAALEGINRLESFFVSLRLPTTFAALGAEAEDIPALAAKVRRNNGDKVGYFKPLDDRGVEAVYKLACK